MSHSATLNYAYYPVNLTSLLPTWYMCTSSVEIWRQKRTQVIQGGCCCQNASVSVGTVGVYVGLPHALQEAAIVPEIFNYLFDLNNLKNISVDCLIFVKHLTEELFICVGNLLYGRQVIDYIYLCNVVLYVIGNLM